MSPEELISKQLTNLKNAFLALKATGTAGFEGFVRIALTEIMSIPFRLAASGLQGGMDGEAPFEATTSVSKRNDTPGLFHEMKSW